jgi:hypothetical protein
VSKAEDTPEAGSGQASSGSLKDSSEIGLPALSDVSELLDSAAQVDSRPLVCRSRPKNVLELISDAIEDWATTCRLATLAVTTALCGCALLFSIQLKSEKWTSVAVVAASVVTVVGVGRRQKLLQFLLRDADLPRELEPSRGPDEQG